jgi:hypothetical protein
MRDGPRRRAAAAAGTVSLGLLLTGGICAGGYALQRVALRAPTHGERVAARAVGVMLRYRFVESTIRIAGRPVLGSQCLQGWMRPQKGRPAGRGARVVFSDGTHLLSGDRQIARLRQGTQPPLRPVIAVELAGCPRPLTDHLYKKLVGGTRAQAVPTTFDGRPAYRMHIRTKSSRFDIFVDRSTLQQLGVRVEAPGVIGWSDTHPRALTPALKRSFLRHFHGR